MRPDALDHDSEGVLFCFIANTLFIIFLIENFTVIWRLFIFTNDGRLFGVRVQRRALACLAARFNRSCGCCATADNPYGQAVALMFFFANIV